jgi:hypothetical protein
MRPIWTRQIIKWKCHICGSRNKIFTELVNTCTGKPVGYTLKCCHCGYINRYIGSPESFIDENDNNIAQGESYCIRLRACPRSGCIYRNKELKDYLDKKGHIIPPDDDKKCCDNCCENCNEPLCEKNPNYMKIHFNNLCTKKFL